MKAALILLSWLVIGAIVAPLLGWILARSDPRYAVPPALDGSDSPSSEEDPRSEPPPREPTVTIREGSHRSSHRVRLYGEGTSLYGEAERLARLARP